MARRHYISAGGVETWGEVPRPGLDVGTFDRRVAAGQYVLCDDDPGPDGDGSDDQDDATPETPTDVSDVLDGNIGEVMAHAEAHPADVAALIDAEQARGDRARVTLIDQLEALRA